MGPRRRGRQGPYKAPGALRAVHGPREGPCTSDVKVTFSGLAEAQSLAPCFTSFFQNS